MLCFAAPEGTAPLTKDQGLPPSQALKGLSFRGVASKLAATRLGHGMTLEERSRSLTPVRKRRERVRDDSLVWAYAGRAGRLGSKMGMEK